MKKQKSMFQMKEQKNNPNETELNDLPDKEFKVTVIRMFTKLGRRIEELRQSFNKELENNQSELKTTIAEMKNRGNKQ